MILKQLKRRHYRAAIAYPLYWLLNKLGRTLVHTDVPWVQLNYAERRIAALSPDLLIDVGANIGQFAQACRERGFGGKILSFEPQPSVFEELVKVSIDDPRWECFNLALGGDEGDMEMHISEFNPSSSLLPLDKLHVELMPQTREVGTLTVPVRRLDDMVRSYLHPGLSVALKIDVQGFEDAVLSGANETLRYVTFAIVELNFAPLFVGQASWAAVSTTFEKAGFRFHSLVNINLDASTKAITWADAVFFRS